MKGDVLSVQNRSTRLWAGLESQLAAAKFLNGGVLYWLRSFSFGVVADEPAPSSSPAFLELSFQLHFSQSSLASCKKFMTWIVLIFAKNVVSRPALTNLVVQCLPQLVPFFTLQIESNQKRYEIYEQTKAYKIKPFVIEHLCLTVRWSMLVRFLDATKIKQIFTLASWHYTERTSVT